VIFWIVRAITVFFHILHNYDIRCFMKVALKIEDYELENFTWHEVQVRSHVVIKISIFNNFNIIFSDAFVMHSQKFSFASTKII
jgi:hypothetical protein